jgi:hypothetical protein
MNDAEYIIDNDGLTYSVIKKAFQKEMVKFNKKLAIDEYGIQLSGIDENNLTDDEAIHILAYTGHSAKWINSIIRESVSIDSLPTNAKHFTSVLDLALSKIKPTTQDIVYRMDSYYSKNDAKKIFKEKLNKTITIKNYLSTDKEEYSNEEIIWIISTLPNGNGKDISNITNNGSEKEILFERNTNFRVNEVNCKFGILYISMTEVNKSP